MAKLMFLVVCNVLSLVALAQDPEATTIPHRIESNQPSSSVAVPQAQSNATQEEPAVTQGEPAVTQGEPAATQKQPAPDAKNDAGDVQGRVPMGPPKNNPQAASSTTTDKPKGGSASVCVNTGLFLVGAAVLLKL